MNKIENEIKNLKCPNCNTETLYLKLNKRFDASFKFYIFCEKCTRGIGQITWDNNIKIYEEKKL